jgi:hypothetical protein
MSLASTSKDDLKSIYANFPGVVILNPGPNPANARQSLDSITMYSSTYGLDHLFHSRFNESATTSNSSNKLQQLIDREAAAAAAAATPRTPPSSSTPLHSSSSSGDFRSSPSSSSSSPPTPTHPQSAWPALPSQVKLEYGPQEMPGDQGIVTYSDQGARTTSIALSAVYFSNPLDDVQSGMAEPPASRTERLRMWSFIKAVCYFHEHLVAGLRVGDISGVIEAIRKFSMSFGSQDTLDGVTAMATLTKKGKSWQEFINTVAKIRNVLDRESDPEWQIGKQLLPGFILRAMEGDPKFDVELTLLRRTRPTPDVNHIMSTLGTKARELSKGQPSLSGYVGAPSQAASTPQGVKELCRNFARDGRCKFDRPSAGQWCRHSHGADEDVKRMAAKKAFKPATTNPAKQVPANTKVKAGKGGAQAAPDGCYRCGSKNHGIDDCTEEVKASVAVTSTTPTDQAPAFNVAEVATAIALALQQQHGDGKAIGMVADPLGVGPSNVYGELDHELAKLFNIKAAAPGR